MLFNSLSNADKNLIKPQLFFHLCKRKVICKTSHTHFKTYRRFANYKKIPLPGNSLWRHVKLTQNGRGVFLCSATSRGWAEWCWRHLHQNRVLSSQVCYLRPSIDPAEQFCNAVGTENCSFRKRLDAQVRRVTGEESNARHLVTRRLS